MNAFHYHRITKEFLLELPVRLDPEEGKPMVPANATMLPPPSAKPGYTRCFLEGNWTQVEDHRGETHYEDGHTPIQIAKLGPVPDGLQPVKAPLSQSEKMAILRVERNRRLLATDWTMLPDVQLHPALVPQVCMYRQALRDLPETVPDLDNVDWPVEPEI
jgi:hypothetical protein